VPDDQASPTPDAPVPAPDDAPTEAVAASDAAPAEAGPTADPAPTEAAPAADDAPGDTMRAGGEAPTTGAPVGSPGRGRRVLVLLLVLVVGVGGGFLLGRATADPGPQSLADAVSETAKGDLPVGRLDLQELLQSIGKDRGGALGQILGGTSSGSGKSSGPLGGLLDDVLRRLGERLQGRDGGSSNGSESATPTATLGVKVQAAPAGTTGVALTEVVTGGSAADAGLRSGDVITAVDGNSVSSPSDLVAAVQDHAPGDRVVVTYTRDGASATATVRLGNQSSTTTTTRPSAST
jgi:membrane-associated protease RseP (regulator of RpoE activity)